MAREICQLVFIKLSEKACTLDSKTILAGWLCRTTRFICADYLKARHRRERREREYAMQNQPTEPEADIWETLKPHLDAALAELAVADQDLLALRFFEKKQFASIGLDLGINDGAAKMRVARALEKLREILAAKGISLTFAALATVMMTNAVRAMPPEMLAPILDHLKSSAHPPHWAQPHRSRWRGVGMLAAMSAILLLSVGGVIVHSRQANRGGAGSSNLKAVTPQKANLDSAGGTSNADPLGTAGASPNAGLAATAKALPVLTPYVPHLFSEDTDDLKFVLEYVAAQLPHIMLADGGGLKLSQVGILGDPAYMTGAASSMNGSAEIKRASSLKDLGDCPVVMIVLDDEDQIKAALAALADRPVITIGLHTNFLVWGGCINFMTLDNLLTFGLNLDRARTIGCNFSAMLTNAAAELFENGKQTCRIAARPGDDTELEFFENKNPFLPKGFTRRMKRLALSEAKRTAVIEAWRQYPAGRSPDEMVVTAMEGAGEDQQRKMDALWKSGSVSAEAMMKIQNEFQEKVDNSISHVAVMESEIREMRPKRLSLLAPVLTPEELFGYRYVIDSEAGKVANLMRVINITPDELRRIAFIFEEHAEGMVNGNFSPETEAILQRELGPVRYAQYKAAYLPAGQELALVVLKYSTPLAHRTFLGDHRLMPKRPY